MPDPVEAPPPRLARSLLSRRPHTREEPRRVPRGARRRQRAAALPFRERGEQPGAGAGLERPPRPPREATGAAGLPEPPVVLTLLHKTANGGGCSQGLRSFRSSSVGLESTGERGESLW